MISFLGGRCFEKKKYCEVGILMCDEFDEFGMGRIPMVINFQSFL